MKWKYFVFGLASFILIGFITYIVMAVKYEDFPWKRFLIYISVALFIVILIGGGVYFLLEYVFNRGETSLVKDIVHISDALPIWKEECIKHTNIPFRAEDGVLVPIRDDAIVIRNETSFVQATESFFAFEAILSDGDRFGSMFAVLKMDLGKDWVRKNWNWKIRDNTTLNTYQAQSRTFPMASEKSEHMRLATKKIELLDDGLSEKEAKFIA